MTHLFAVLQAQELVEISNLEALQKVSLKLFYRLLIDFVSVFILVRGVYFHVYKRLELFFTFFIFNLVIFLICFLLNKVDLSMGAAFGLFAVFSMLRYRTEDISIKDMSYLFLVIAIGLISAVTKVKNASDSYEYIFLILINSTIIVLAYLLESKVLFKKEAIQIINYDNMDLIQSQNQTLLIEDIKKRTGINAHRISISKIDFLKPSVQIKVYYFED
ncbi:DUF4956 domain-containing protein [Aurantibacillus circumpalustris]|uniref:DUF4956 domain-containing protein n=1 Tax=Aurantibacillus circumpalustris TaxID=3036359 RepID=UPI00295BB06A|nr:DUF4956 domain-containing protein [Aurantibacillus circumpalustris]